MAKTAKTKLTEVKKQSGEVKTFKKYVGGRYFFFGPDKPKAEKLALALLAKWAEKKATEADPAWTDAEISAAQSMREQAYGRSDFDGLDDAALNVGAEKPQNAPESFQKLQVVTDYAMSVGDAIDAYEAHIDASAKSKRWKLQLKHRVSKLRDSIGELSLSELGHTAIANECERWIAHAKEGEFAISTAENQIKALRQFTTWADEADEIEYEAPKRYERIFRKAITRQDVRTLKRKKEAPKTFSKAELQKLWKATDDDSERLYFLLALNCGFTQIDLSELKAEHVNWKAKKIEYRRSKTGVYAEFLLWDETLELLKPYKGQEGVLFRTRRGKTLVSFSDKGNAVDSVRQLWDKLRKRAGVKGSFKLLRKTASQAIRDIKGSDYAEAFLAHTEKGVGASYNRFQHWQGLAQAVKTYRQQLKPVLG